MTSPAPGPSDPLILLVNPDWRHLKSPGRFRTGVPYFPLELMYIESDLQRRGLPAQLVDLWGKNIEEEFERLLPQASFLVVTSAPTYAFWRDGICEVDYPRQHIDRMRALAPRATIIAIGPQGTVIPESFDGSEVDFLVRGEPDLEVGELIETLEEGKDPDSLAGVCPMVDGQVQVNEGVALVRNMANLPPLKLDSIRTGQYGQAVYEASRGCPYNCSFCCRAGFREKFRVKPMELIQKDIQSLKQSGYNYIFLIDEIFGFEVDWQKEFCEMIRPLNLFWGIQTRQECLSLEKVENLVGAGCVSIEIGLESADPEVAKRIHKNSNLEKLTASVRKACELGIQQQVRLFCIIGAPGETIESIRHTEEYLMQFADLDKVQVDLHPMLPLPGTEVWEIGRQRGLDLKTWSDVWKYAGIVDNAFSDPEQVAKICARITRQWQYRRMKEELSLSFAGRIVLMRMWITMHLPALSGWRRKLCSLLPGSSFRS